MGAKFWILSPWHWSNLHACLGGGRFPGWGSPSPQDLVA